MLKDLEELKTLMPPLVPAPENEVDWAMAEDVFGLRFPTDFKAFVFTYGNVIWCDTFRPIYPETATRQQCEKSRDEVLELVANIGKVCDDMGRPIPGLNPYPSAGGLLPCLTTTNSSLVCWIAAGEPDSWNVVQWFFSGDTRPFPCDLTHLIRTWVKQVPPGKDAWGSFFLQPGKYGIAR